MSLYEITFLTKEETDPGVRQTLEEVGATIEEESSLGRRRLIYPVKRETQAVYTTYVFNTDPSTLSGVNRKLGLNNQVLRYLIVTKETAKADKEVSKTVQEAIAAAEKLEDTVAEEPQTVTAVPENSAFAEATADKQESNINLKSDEIVIEKPATAAEEEKLSESSALESRIPKRKRTAKKAESAAEEKDAVTMTEEDRLKALEDKLGEILKD